MDPVLRVATSLHGALKVAAQLFTQLEASSEDVFVRAEFARDIAAKLADAAADAAELYESSGDAHKVTHFVEEFRKRNDRNVIAVHADSESLLAMSQSAEDERTHPEFISTTDKFALGLAQSLSDIVDRVAMELQNHAHPPCLRISEARFVQGLAACLRQTLEAHVTLGTSYRDARAEADSMATECIKLTRVFSTQIESLRKDVAQLQTNYTQLGDENEQLKEQLRGARGLYGSENARREAERAKYTAEAQGIIDNLTNEILVERSVQGSMSSQLLQMEATLKQTRQEAEWNHLRAVSEENERERLASLVRLTGF
ncbi:hypothetical protein K466DRAFT_594449 [Polyporus arcularius HHB13444]|uniref:Uncharacterized protein n=1 Tax=Polyporus arcularius HHB13444 TaxID=1314778 RepID=A0A5C3PVF0_9APHY|nr:hypothetical protein K466DRAFT_594449 [Polyporus arcularius HHB13444]